MLHLTETKGPNDYLPSCQMVYFYWPFYFVNPQVNAMKAQIDTNLPVIFYNILNKLGMLWGKSFIIHIIPCSLITNYGDKARVR